MDIRKFHHRFELSPWGCYVLTTSGCFDRHKLPRVQQELSLEYSRALEQISRYNEEDAEEYETLQRCAELLIECNKLQVSKRVKLIILSKVLRQLGENKKIETVTYNDKVLYKEEV